MKLLIRGEHKENCSLELAVIRRLWRTIPGHQWNALTLTIPIPIWREEEAPEWKYGMVSGWFFRSWCFVESDGKRETFAIWEPWKVTRWEKRRGW